MDYKKSKKMESQENKFTGVFIPAAIYEMEEISWAEKILWCEICALAGKDTCYATNEYFAKKYKTTPEKISARISKLKKFGLVKQVNFDGRRRFLKPCYEITKDESISNEEDSIIEINKSGLSKRISQDYQNGEGSYNKYKYKEKIKEESVNELEPAQQQVKTNPPISDKNTNNKPNSVSNFRTQEEFIPPTLEEVLEYAKEQNNFAGTVGFRCSKKTAELFWSNYEANGWIISNECRTPIKDWKAKLRNWAIKESFISAKNDDIIQPKRATGDK